jgi:hypothetical protein
MEAERALEAVDKDLIEHEGVETHVEVQRAEDEQRQSRPIGPGVDGGDERPNGLSSNVINTRLPGPSRRRYASGAPVSTTGSGRPGDDQNRLARNGIYEEARRIRIGTLPAAAAS